MKTIFSSLLLFFCLFSFNIFSQDPEIDTLQQKNNPHSVKIFLNCAAQNCYEDFLKTELSFFDFVRDRFQADVQILMASQASGGGGLLYTLTFIGQNEFTNQNDTLRFDTKQADSDDMIRQKLLKMTKLGLILYVNKHNNNEDFEINFPKRTAEQAMVQQDKWNYWVFTLGTNGYSEGESNRFYLWFQNYLRINRITNKSKFNFSANYNQTINRITIKDSAGNEKINRAKTENYNFAATYVKSLTPHWAVGGYYNGFHSIFQNIQFQHRIAPAIEYNIFPISDNTRRQFRWIYQVGVRKFDYITPTIFDKTSEFRPYQQLNAVLDLTQPWGTLRTVLTASNYLDNFKQNRKGINIELSWRIAEGLNFNTYGGFFSIKDQISLAAQKADDGTILLGGSQLPTSFSYWTSFGFTYTFGSINNSVVNPRFAGID